MQSPRCTTFVKLTDAKKLTDLTGKTISHTGGLPYVDSGQVVFLITSQNVNTLLD